MPRRASGSQQEGAVAVTTAILLVALVLMAAFVVDLGMLRVDHRDSQTVVDMAAAAGGLELGADIDRVSACEAAWKFLVNNLTDVPDNEPEPSGNTCADNFSGDCDPTVRDELVTTLAGGDLEVVIRMPVFDNDDPMQPARQAIVSDVDGTPCERISVEVRRLRDHRLGVVAGFDEGSSTAGAVARRTHTGDEERFVSLMVLDREGCSTIKTSGGPSFIEVKNATAADGTVHPGTISVDTVPPGAGCGPNNKIFDVDNGHIFAEGDIFSHGLEVTGSTADVYDDPISRLAPPPEPGPILRRTHMDHRYNCKSGGYGPAPEPYMPDSTALSAEFRQDGVPACDNGHPSYIEGLHDYLTANFALDPLDIPAAFAADGFRIYPDPAEPTESCGDVIIPEDVGDDSTKWFFDCDGGATVKGGNPLTIPDAELVVFSGDLEVSGQARINVTTDLSTAGGSDATMVLWDGGLTVKGHLATRTTFIYLNETVRTRLTTEGGGGIDLEAPLGVADCETSGKWPTAECFEDLAIWQNGEGSGPQDEMGLAGSGDLIVIGSVFVPNALINIGGSGTTDLDDAQFFGWQFWYHGGGTLTLIPNPERGTPVLLFGAGLIR